MEMGILSKFLLLVARLMLTRSFEEEDCVLEDSNSNNEVRFIFGDNRSLLVGGTNTRPLFTVHINLSWN